MKLVNLIESTDLYRLNSVDSFMVQVIKLKKFLDGTDWFDETYIEQNHGPISQFHSYVRAELNDIFDHPLEIYTIPDGNDFAIKLNGAYLNHPDHIDYDEISYAINSNICNTLNDKFALDVPNFKCIKTSANGWGCSLIFKATPNEDAIIIVHYYIDKHHFKLRIGGETMLVKTMDALVSKISECIHK